MSVPASFVPHPGIQAGSASPPALHGVCYKQESSPPVPPDWALRTSTLLSQAPSTAASSCREDAPEGLRPWPPPPVMPPGTTPTILLATSLHTSEDPSIHHSLLHSSSYGGGGALEEGGSSRPRLAPCPGALQGSGPMASASEH